MIAQGADGALKDFVDLSVHAVAAVAIEPAGPLPVRAGDTALLAARAFDPDGVRLAGSLDYAWTSSNTSIVELIVTGPEAGSRVRAIAHAEGHATIRVTGPAVSTSLAIEVQP